MSVVLPALEPSTSLHAPAPFGAMVARQLSVWPFGARTTRLFLLIDPSVARQTLRAGLLKAMQQAYFASDGYSQTRAVREAALAAHYVLRHHNRDVLPLDQVNAASAVAAVRGNVAFVALAGHAAAFAWHAGDLTGQRGILRLPRPLGLAKDPVITLWRTPLDAGDRLVLVCGAHWRPESEDNVRAILASSSSTAEAEHELSLALGDARPASVLVITPAARAPHLRLVSAREEHEHGLLVDAEPAPQVRRQLSVRKWLFPFLGLLLLGLVAIAALALSPRVGLPADRTDALTPRLAVRLGASAQNVVDLAAGDTSLYTLDVVEGTVRAYALDGSDQQPGPETLLARAGTPVSGAADGLAQPVAIEYLPGTPGSLVVIDQARNVVQLGQDGQLSRRYIPSSSAWRELGALGSGPAGELLFLDSRAHQLLAYPTSNQLIADAPRLVLDDATAPRLSFERIAQVVAAPQALLVRLDDGSVHRLSAAGADQPLALPAVDGQSGAVSAIAEDGAGGVFLADPLDARVVQTTVDGTLVRELRSPALAGVRAIATSVDGRRLYALVASGVLVADIPSL